MTETDVRADRNTDLACIRDLLQRKPIFFRFPAAMEADFQAKRIESSLFYISSGQWLLIAMFLTMIAVAGIGFQKYLSTNHYFLLKYIYGPVGLGILFIIYGPTLDWVKRHYHHVMLAVSTFQIIAIQEHIFLSVGTGYYAFAVYNQMICLLLVALGLRFPTPMLVAQYAGCAAVSVGIALLARLDIQPLAFSYYFLLYGLVIVVLAWIAERQERFGFLQELMVSYQSEELARLNRRLDKIAHEDALTGIANRRSFDDTAEREWERALREQRPLSLLLDVDYFKRYNDTYGHDGGDKCLQDIARSLREALMRPADLAARYGGEEFAVLLPDTHQRGAVMVAERIIRWVDGRQIPHAGSSVSAHVTVSIGVTTLVPAPAQSLRDVVKQADEALYAAKAGGRHQYRVYRAPDSEPRSEAA